MKKFCRLFVVLVAIISLLCSNNTYAFDYGTFNSSLTPVAVYSSESGTQQTWKQGSGISQGYYIPAVNKRSFWNFSFDVRGNPRLQKGMILTFEYAIFNDRTSVPDSCPVSAGTNTWGVIDCDTSYAVIDSNGEYTVYGYKVDTLNGTGWALPSTGNTVDAQFNGRDYIITYHRLILRWDSDSTPLLTTVSLGGQFAHVDGSEPGSVLLSFSSGISLFNSGTDLNDILEYLEEHPDNSAQVLENQRSEDKSEMQDSQSDASSSGSDSQSQADNTGQTLLQAFISFVTAITNANPSNCNIDMNTGFIDFGVVNLCSLSPPPAFQVISSIVVIGFAVPLSLAASKKMIELFRSFQT